MRKLLLVIVIAVSTFAIAQEPKPLATVDTATCDDPRTAGGKSKWIQSKAGVSAAVEVRARVTGSGNRQHCTTSWILHVRGDDKKDRAIAVAEREDVPADNEWTYENSFDLIAWSPDGKLVLVAQIEAAGDWDETTPIVYDFSTGTYFRVELEPLFKKLIPSGCGVFYRPLRFADNGTVVLSVASTDNDRSPGTKACLEDSLWQLDFRRKTVRQVPPISKTPRPSK